MAQEIDLITLKDPRSAGAEAYRTLRTNLTFTELDNPIESLVVASPAPGDEDAKMIANLAIAMAQGERRTVLVDANLRRPCLHEIFDVDNKTGLTTMIVKETAYENPPLTDVGVENLWLLPSGPLPPNPADILGSGRMEIALTALKAQADVILFNTPPIIAVTDAIVLSTKTDGVLLVVNAGRTRREHVERAQELLEKVHVRIVGAVLNDAPRGVAFGGY